MYAKTTSGQKEDTRILYFARNSALMTTNKNASQ